MMARRSRMVLFTTLAACGSAEPLTSAPGDRFRQCSALNNPCDPLVECLFEDTAAPICGACPEGFTDVNGNGTRCTLSNQLLNPDFELIFEGLPREPPTDWLSSGTRLSPVLEVPYLAFGTQAHAPSLVGASGDTGVSFPGLGQTRALKMEGLGLDDGAGGIAGSRGLVFQVLDAVPAGSSLLLRGWAYVSSADPLGTANEAYLVIRCFDSQGVERCGGGDGARSTPTITSATQTNTWVEYFATFAPLDPSVELVEVGVEIEQCANQSCSALEEHGGAVYWDDVAFNWR